MTGHGFCGLASTILHEKEYPHEHRIAARPCPANAVSAAYNHAQHLKGRTKMMQEWADLLEQTQRGLRCCHFWKWWLEVSSIKDQQGVSKPTYSLDARLELR
jgi:hypothetical protein